MGTLIIFIWLTSTIMSEKKLTGLQMPLNVSPELALIIGTKKGEQVSRPQVIKKLWAYLKEKNLQDPENKQFFTPDKAMKEYSGTRGRSVSGCPSISRSTSPTPTSNSCAGVQSSELKVPDMRKFFPCTWYFN